MLKNRIAITCVLLGNATSIPRFREWAYLSRYTHSEGRGQQIHPWVNYYNFARPHGSLGYAPPISRAPVPERYNLLRHHRHPSANGGSAVCP